MLEIPVLANLQVTRSFHLLAGPQLSFLTSAMRKRYIYYNEPDKYQQLPDEEVGTKTYIGFVVGATYKLTKKVSALLQYDMDLNDHVFYGGNAKNTALQIGVNYHFR